MNSYIYGIEGEINFSIKGTVFGVGASFVGTFYTIYVKHFMDDIVKNQWLLSFYNHFNSLLIIPILVVLNGEIPILIHHRREITLYFIAWVFAAGLVGLFVGLATQLQIKYTSALSHNISGVMKNCIQSFIGALFYKNHLTMKSIWGILLVVSGSFSYALERLQVNTTVKQNEEPTSSLLNSEIQESEERVCIRN